MEANTLNWRRQLWAVPMQLRETGSGIYASVSAGFRAQTQRAEHILLAPVQQRQSVSIEVWVDSDPVRTCRPVRHHVSKAPGHSEDSSQQVGRLTPTRAQLSYRGVRDGSG